MINLTAAKWWQNLCQYYDGEGSARGLVGCNSFEGMKRKALITQAFAACIKKPPTQNLSFLGAVYRLIRASA
jgi:hypothetical protein